MPEQDNPSTLPPRAIAKAAAITAGLGAIGFALFPLTGLDEAGAHGVFVAGIVAGAFPGSVLSALRLRRRGSQQGSAGPAEPKTVFVGNLPFKATQNEIQAIFAQYGQVHSVRLMTDRGRRPRGFGFVEMDAPAADAAIRALDGTTLGGRELKVNEGRKRPAGQRRRANA